MQLKILEENNESWLQLDWQQTESETLLREHIGGSILNSKIEQWLPPKWKPHWLNNNKCALLTKTLDIWGPMTSLMILNRKDSSPVASLSNTPPGDIVHNHQQRAKFVELWDRKVGDESELKLSLSGAWSTNFRWEGCGDGSITFFFSPFQPNETTRFFFIGSRCLLSFSARPDSSLSGCRKLFGCWVGNILKQCLLTEQSGKRNQLVH